MSTLQRKLDGKAPHRRRSAVPARDPAPGAHARVRPASARRPDRQHSRYRGVVLHGKPATGKGTQGRILDAMPGFVHVAAGRLLRSVAEEFGALAHRVGQVLARGDLVPDELMVTVLERHLAQLSAKEGHRRGSDLLALDGVPRTVGQVELLADHVDVRLIVHLLCDDDAALLERVRRRSRLEGRSDDRLQTARRRLATFERETAPVIDAYPSSIRAEIDALQHPVLVHDEILHALIRRSLVQDALPQDGMGRGGAA